MTITIELAPDERTRLAAAARQQGIDPAALARRLVIEHLPGASPVEQALARIREWQAQDNAPFAPPIATPPGETPTQALFRQWKEEDAGMTAEAKEAEDRLWEEIEKGLDENRARLRLRQLVG